MAGILKTQNDVFRLAASGGESVYFDEGKDSERVVGLGLRIRRGGSRRFVYFYRWGGRLEKLTIGDAGSWSLDQARAQARAHRVDIDKGVNPKNKKQEAKAAQAKKQTLFGVVADDYLTARQPGTSNQVRKRKAMKPRSWGESSRHLRQHWKSLRGIAIANIERRDVAATLRTIADKSGPVAADRARSTLSAMFAWAIGEGLCESNPVIGTNKSSDDVPRDRALSDRELVTLWNGLPNDGYGTILRLLILTGCRREEVGGLRWSEIDFKARTMTLPPHRTKNSSTHVIPLSDAAIDLLKSCHARVGRDLIFGRGRGGYSGWSRSKERLDEKLSLEHWTPHDLRRTVSTGLRKLGVLPHVVEAVLNHLPDKLVRTYAPTEEDIYAAEKRAALDLWADHLKSIVLGKPKGITVKAVATGSAEAPRRASLAARLSRARA